MAGTILAEAYEIVKCISSSEFCNIYIAEDVDDKKVIVKELFDEAIESKSRDEAIEKLKKEAEIYKKLEHENIVRVIDCFSSASAVYMENKQFVVMEYIEGKTLREIKEEKKEKFAPEDLAPWFLEICDALSFLTEQNPSLLFYYLSPDHVMITDEGKVKLINCGLGRYFKSGPFKSNQYMGVAGYAAPEQYGIKEIDGKADIFGLGAISYYMLTGDDPEKHPLKFSPVRQLNPIVSMPFARLISKCLNMKPEERFSSHKELKEKFSSIALIDVQVSPDMIKKKQSDQITVKLRPSRVLGKEMLGWRERLWWTAEKYLPESKRVPALIILFLIAGISFLVVRHITAEDKFPSSFIYATQAGADYVSVIDKNKKELYKKLDTGECRSKMIFSGNKIYIGGPVSNLIIIDPERLEVEEDIKIGSNILDMVMTEDGKVIYSTDASGGKVVKVMLEEEAVTTSIKVGNVPVGLALSDNEHYLYVANFKSNNISIIDTTDNTISGTIEKVGKGPKKLIVMPEKDILYCLNWGSDDIALINIANNTLVKKIDTGKAPADFVLSPDGKTLYVANSKEETLSVIDLEKEALASTVELPAFPNCMILSENGKELFVSLSTEDRKENKIVVLDMKTNDIKDEITLEKSSLSLMEVNVK